MSIKLQAGISYTLHNGEKVGPMELSRWGWFYVQDEQGCWLGNGLPRDDYTAEKLGPIISEWSEGPVRTVTRREVVEWSDDILTVVPHEDGHVLIGFKHPHDQHYISLSKKQIMSACMIMSQIAEALDDKEVTK